MVWLCSVPCIALPSLPRAADSGCTISCSKGKLKQTGLMIDQRQQGPVPVACRQVGIGREGHQNLFCRRAVPPRMKEMTFSLSDEGVIFHPPHPLNNGRLEPCFFRFRSLLLFKNVNGCALHQPPQIRNARL
ncbi:hypothetical protein BJ166DRAFT_521582 [Pestalotiopsis sp. NC0098]|nr:hypothetical protein BJ166DRAFT_521582 [Pestalotiopsis sp. NC0098]